MNVYLIHELCAQGSLVNEWLIDVNLVVTQVVQEIKCMNDELFLIVWFYGFD